MARKKRSKVESGEACGVAWCGHGGRCARAGGRRVCLCAGAWGGARCQIYVGHDHACAARACAPPALCVWGDDVSNTEAGEVYCACLEGTSCSAPAAGAPPPPAAEGAGAAWAGAILVIVSLAALGALLAILCRLRRRQSAFVHARLADNVEISNPMYLAGEDELEPPPNGNHFANPVYDTMYAPSQPSPPEEHATLLSTGEGSPAPAERAALL